MPPPDRPLSLFVWASYRASFRPGNRGSAHFRLRLTLILRLAQPGWRGILHPDHQLIRRLALIRLRPLQLRPAPRRRRGPPLGDGGSGCTGMPMPRPVPARVALAFPGTGTAGGSW